MSSFRLILALLLVAGVSRAGEEHKDEEKHGKGEKHAGGEKHADGEKHAEGEEHKDGEKHAEDEKHADGEKHTDGEKHADGDKHAEGEKHADGEKHSDGDKHAEGDKHADGEKHDEKGAKEEAANPNVGAGKAVEAIDHDKGMKLSAKAAATLGVKTAPVAGSDPYRVQAASLVFFQDEVGVYRLRDGWLKLIEVQVVEKSKKDAVVRTREMKRGDQIVVAGTALIRVTELDLSSGDVGHGH